jgi:nucleoid-associated protein YgaU
MDLEQMKRKYAAVWTTAEQQHVELSHVHIQDNKLLIQGIAPSDAANNKVWDQIKAVSPNWAEELTVDIRVDPTRQQTTAGSAGGAGQSYTVKPGDTLSKISKQFYGNANSYMKIFEANRDILRDPNKIEVGQTLKIPA